MASERPAKEKFSHAQVAYEHPAKGEDHCGECRHYIKETPMRCEIVRNPIRAEDWCRKFKEVPGESAAYERKEHEDYASHNR